MDKKLYIIAGCNGAGFPCVYGSKAIWHSCVIKGWQKSWRIIW